MWQCPRRHKVNKREKYNTPERWIIRTSNQKLSYLRVQTSGLSAPKRILLKHSRPTLDYTLSLAHTLIYILLNLPIFNRYRSVDIDVNMDSCIHATSFLLWVSILKCAITVVWVLVILETLGSQRFFRILEETLDIISFMRPGPVAPRPRSALQHHQAVGYHARTRLNPPGVRRGDIAAIKNVELRRVLADMQKIAKTGAPGARQAVRFTFLKDFCSHVYSDVSNEKCHATTLASRWWVAGREPIPTWQRSKFDIQQYCCWFFPVSTNSSAFV